MYQPDHFKDRDVAQIRSLVSRFPLATCIAHTGTEFEINHLPVMWRDNTLIGHIALANNMHRILENGGKAAFVFQGEDTYITPNWYPTKSQHHEHVPTWNYQVVHMHGDLYFDHSDKAKRAAVGQLTKLHETRLNGDRAWAMRDAPDDFIAAKIADIVAIRFHINSIEAKSKLSQNRDAIDFQGVQQHMEDAGCPGLGNRMQTWSD